MQKPVEAALRIDIKKNKPLELGQCAHQWQTASAKQQQRAYETQCKYRVFALDFICPPLPFCTHRLPPANTPAQLQRPVPSPISIRRAASSCFIFALASYNALSCSLVLLDNSAVLFFSKNQLTCQEITEKVWDRQLPLFPV